MNNENAKETLLNSLKQHTALPFLFIGSGMSRRYLGLPDWKGLLSNFSDKLDKNFNYYLSRANSSYPLAASHIADDFHDYWWNSDEYEESRQQNSHLVETREAPLKVAVSDFINKWDSDNWRRQQSNRLDIEEEISAFKNVTVDGIITTNYDNLTDMIFPNFKEYIGQDDILLSDAQFIAESFKIHGSSKNFESLILTDSDYENYLHRNHYITAKLLTIFAEHPVIFLGYSITDEYIGQILNNIAEAVGPNRLDELGSRIYFVEFNSSSDFEPLIERTSQGHGTSQLPMTKIETFSYTWIWETLSLLERPFPAALLRELKNHVFELINNPSPDQSVESVKAVPIDGADAEGLKVVFGVAAVSDTDLADISTISARSLERTDLVEDILEIRARKLSPEAVLTHGIPRGIRPSRKAYVPVYKYLRESGRIGPENAIDFSNLPEIIKLLTEKEITPSPNSKNRFNELLEADGNVYQNFRDSDLPNYLKGEIIINMLSDERIRNLKEIKSIFVEIFNGDEINSTTYKALFLYDKIKYLDAWEG